MYKCQYCNKEFIRKHALTKHQRVAKYCLNIQRTIELEKELLSNNPAPNDNKELHKKIEELEKAHRKELDELKNLITQTNSKSPVVQNMEPVTVSHIEAMALEHLDITDLENGLEGIVDFTVKYPLLGRVVCTDKSRRKFKYTNEDGNIVNDYGGTKLSRTVFEGIQSRCVQLIDTKYASLTNDIKNVIDTTTEFQDSVLENMKKGTQLQNLKNELLEAAKGTENELQKSYIRKLVSHY